MERALLVVEELIITHTAGCLVNYSLWLKLKDKVANGGAGSEFHDQDFFPRCLVLKSCKLQGVASNKTEVQRHDE